MKKMSVKLMIVVFCAVVWPGLVLAAGPDTSPAPPPPAPPGQTSQAPPGPFGPAGGPDFVKFAKIDALAIKGLDMSFPPTFATIIGDAGGIRSNLAEVGIGFLGYSINTGMYNFRNDKTPGAVYNGKDPTYFMGSQGLFLTYDAGKIGLKDGQFQLTVNANTNGLTEVNPQDKVTIQQLAYFQSFNNDMFELTFGYLSLPWLFMNVQVAGSFAEGSLGPAATLMGQLRAGFPGLTTPGVVFRNNGPDFFYNKVGVVRSLPNIPPDQMYDNIDLGLRLSQPHADALVIDEFGYNRPPGPGQNRLWLRAGGLYNFTKFTNFKTGGEDSNYGFYAMGDYQVWHPDPTPRGLYVGATFNYAPPERNIFTQYYEARLYAIGPIPGRPFDMASLVFNYSVISRDFQDFNATPPPPPPGAPPGALPGAPPGAPSVSGVDVAGYNYGVVAAYAWQLFPGVIIQPGVGIRQNPVLTPKVPLTIDGYLCLAFLF